MRKVAVVVVLMLYCGVSAQTDSEDAPLPSPYQDSTGRAITVEHAPSQQPVTTKVVVRQSSGRGSASSMNSIRANARRGVGTYIAGFVLEYGVAVPLSLVGVFTWEPGVIVAAGIVELVSTGFLMAGPIRAGVAASEAYDYSRAKGFSIEKNSNWGFYQVGWVLKVVAGTFNMIVQAGGEGMDQSSAQALSFVALGSSIAAESLWMTSVINAAKYTQKVEKHKPRLSFSLFPTYSLKTGATGLGMQLCF